MNNGQLVLFSQPKVVEDLTGNVKLGQRKNDAGEVTGLTVSLESRKQVAKLMGVKQKSSAVTEALLKTSDAIKQASLREVVVLAGSQEWTGGTVRVTRGKNGLTRKSFAFHTVDRTPGIKAEDVARALAAMSEDEQIAIMEKAEAMKAEANATEVPALDNQTAEMAA
jgi:hypothetical protein